MTKALSMKEVRAYDAGKLRERLHATRLELRKLQARVAAQDLKDVRAIRATRQALARLLTRERELRATSLGNQRREPPH